MFAQCETDGNKDIKTKIIVTSIRVLFSKATRLTWDMYNSKIVSILAKRWTRVTSTIAGSYSRH